MFNLKKIDLGYLKSNKVTIKKYEDQFEDRLKSYDFNKEFYSKLFNTMEAYNDYYFILLLNCDGMKVKVRKEDPLIDSEFVNNRMQFLEYSIDNGFEFSSVRRSRYSTRMVLYKELVNRLICIECGQKCEVSCENHFITFS